MDPTVTPESATGAPGRIFGLFDSPAALSSLLNQLPVGVIIIDADRRVKTFNRSLEALVGFDPEEMRDLPCRHVLRLDRCHGHCPLDQVNQTSAPVTFGGDLINRLRRKIHVRVTAAPIRDPGGRIIGYLETVEDVHQLEPQVEHLGQRLGFRRLLGNSPQMQNLFATLPAIAQTDSSVLITGETGTGKDILAEVIHEASARAEGPFIKINCGALPENLLESELFGHTKGAFTGAVGDKPGRIRLAHQGTLYLTEIGDLPLPLQVKLLTFLDDKVVYPLGGTKGHAVDVRLMAATHRDLEAMVASGRFREDLLYRLNVVRLHIPPLRERGADVRLLADHFLKGYVQRFGKPVKGLAGPVLDILQAHSYPGNVRELKNIIEYAVNVCPGEVLEPGHLPLYLIEPRAGEDRAAPWAAPEMDAPPAGAPGPVARPRGHAPGVNWADIERQMIIDALIKSKGRRLQAAEILGWCRSTLWRKMKLHQLDA
jgi:two-component system response regulator AtoC